jgi:hypothetical protein
MREIGVTANRPPVRFREELKFGTPDYSGIVKLFAP